MVNLMNARMRAGRGHAPAASMVCAVIASVLFSPALHAQTEDDYYPLVTIPLPQQVVLEVGGLLNLPDGRLMAATRRGEVYIIENGYTDPPNPQFKQWAFGLSEPLGLQYKDGWVYTAQRGELTRMKDTDGDDRADVFETVCDSWEISGNYHEYAFGPAMDKQGNFWITLNKPFGDEPYGRAHWRGWAVKVTPDGVMHPMAVGLRSPAGVEVSPDGDVFYTDNQGEWCNASKLSHIEPGDFHGHPHGLPSIDLPQSPFKSPRARQVPNGQFMKDLHYVIPNFKMPAVWFPYGRMGKSPSGMAWDTTGGKFGPFEGQLFVGDQHDATILRVFLEKVDDHWQGACFNFRKGLQCGVIRVLFGVQGDGMWVGQSNRGWGSLGGKPYGLQRIVWNGQVPFEIHQMRVAHDGFTLTFTQPVDKQTAGDPASYSMTSYTYRLRSDYGGPDEDVANVTIREAKVADDGKSVRLVIDPIRAGYVHELHADGVRSAEGKPLLHREAYYTLVKLPAQ